MTEKIIKNSERRFTKEKLKEVEEKARYLVDFRYESVNTQFRPSK